MNKYNRMDKMKRIICLVLAAGMAFSVLMSLLVYLL